MKSFFFILFLLVACEKESVESALTSSDSALDQAKTVLEDQTSEQVLLDLINNHRKGLGLKALKLEIDISALTELHSQDMSQGKIIFGHLGFSDRCADARLILGGGNLCGENVAMGQKSALAAFTAWMNSSGHRAHIEQSRFTHTGIGLAISSTGTFYWTELFLERN